MGKIFKGQSIDKSKVVSDTITVYSKCNIEGSLPRNIGFKSGTKAAVNPTTMLGSDYGMSNKGGSSGDGPTPGFTGSGRGVDSLNNAQQ